MHTQDEMRVLGDEYVPEAQDVKFNKSELQKALKKALKSPRVYVTSFSFSLFFRAEIFEF